MKCLVTKLPEGINKAGLHVFNMNSYFEDVSLTKTYTANGQTGVITHGNDWTWLAGVVTPISNDGNIVGVKLASFSYGTIRVVAIYCFSEYDDVNNIHTLNTDYGDEGRIAFMISGEKLLDYVNIGTDVKYITIRVGGQADSDIGDFINANTILQLERIQGE